MQVTLPPEGGPTAPSEAAPSEGPATGEAASSPSAASPIFMFVMLFGVMALFMWQNRSQQKKQAQAVAALKKGDRVATQSGLIGRLVEKDSRYAKLEIAPGIKVEVLLSSVVGRDADPGTKKEDDKGNPDSK